MGWCSLPHSLCRFGLVLHPAPPIASIWGRFWAEVVGVCQTLTVPALGCPGGRWRTAVPRGCCVPLGKAFKPLFPAWALSLCKQVTAVSFVPQPFSEVEGKLSAATLALLPLPMLLHSPDTHICCQQWVSPSPSQDQLYAETH